MKIFIFSAALVLLCFSVVAQVTGKISGSITQNGKPAEGATVSLLHARDSSVKKLSVVNKDGLFVFENLPEGTFLLLATKVGYDRYYSRPVTISAAQSAVEIPAMALVSSSKALSDVTVTARKALIEHKIDRTVLNVDASITNIGSSALEVLEKAPGVTVDRDGNISLKGKEGVLVMVDGRPTQLSGPDLTNLLRGLNANQLDQIEIMTNPPARYEASGTSGIINIKTKKITKAGMNGSANLTYTQGRYAKTAEAFNFNYRENRINLYTNLSHNYVKRYSDLMIDRNILNSNDNSIDRVFNQTTNRLSTSHSYNGKFGVDFFATKKTTLGAVVNLSARPGSSYNPNVSYISNASKVLQSVTRAIVQNETDWKSVTANMNLRTVLDTKGKELTADVDFLKYNTDNSLLMVNSYTDASGNAFKKSDTLQGVLPQDIEVYSARVDYVHPLSKKARFEAGLKSSIARTDNNARYDSIEMGNVIHDVNRSNHFLYEENINAAYLNLSTDLSKKLSAQLGLRLENTNARGKQKTTSDNFDRQYTQLFPTAYFQYKASEQHNFGASFGRRVRRPGYQNLNPFIRFLDRYTYSQGNPNLKPSISNNYELSHSWKNLITTTLNYTKVTDIMQEVIQQKGEEAYNMAANVASLDQFGILVNSNTPITKWWTSIVNLNVYKSHFKGVVGTAPVDLSAAIFVINGTQQFKISKTFSAELTGVYRTRSLEGVIEVKPIGFIGAGLSKQVMKNKGTIRLTARDIFRTQRMTGTSRYGNVDFQMRQVSENQVVAIGFTYSFSKGKRIAPVKRTAGSATEEQSRVGQ